MLGHDGFAPKLYITGESGSRLSSRWLRLSFHVNRPSQDPASLAVTSLEAHSMKMRTRGESCRPSR